MTGGVTKIAKLKFARQRIISDAKHVVASIKTFNSDTSRLLIACKSRALEQKWKEFQDNLEDIESTVDKIDDQDTYFANNQQIEDEYIKAKIKIAELISQSKDADVTLDQSFFMPSASEGRTRKSQPSHSSRLPEIELTKFNGQYDEWNKFSQLFQKMITRNDLDEIDKIYYLHSSLRGEAAQLIKHLPLTESSFETAWKLLQSQYDVRRHMVNTQFQLFFSIKKMAKENAEELKKMLRIILECESAFSAMKMETDSLGSMMVYYCVKQMDAETAKNWEMEMRDETNEPKLSALIAFLQTRCRLLSQIERNNSSSGSTSISKTENNKQQKPSRTFLAQSKNVKPVKCNVCAEAHRTFECPTLVNATVSDRKKIIVEKKLCFNCLYNHKVEECLSRWRCTHCKKRHNSLLHEETETASANEPETTFTAYARESRSTLLATALIPVYYGNGNKIFVRALIDQGSTSNFISENLCQLTLARRFGLNTTVTSLNDSKTGKISAFTNITVGSLYDDNYRLTFDALILNKITNVDSTKKINSSEWSHLNGIELADPKYFEPGNIDILIGARIYAEVILSGLRKGHKNSPIAQLTKFGWVLSGSCDKQQSHTSVSCNFSVLEENKLSKQLQQFFELEEVNRKVPINNDNAVCEQKFLDGLTRAGDGKFMLELPFKIDPNTPNFLGDSYKSAMMRLFQVEKRLMKDPKLHEMYKEVIHEYITLNHMREATPEEIQDTSHAYFMPHHAVIKMDRTTTKVRVVFDASNKSSKGKSLNEMLMVGPTIQDDLFTILTRWRKFKIAFSGDIEKMYRQIWIKPEHTKYLRILWRDNINEPIKQYILLTVTFGTASAPYQAIRALHQVAQEIEVSQPDIAHAIRKKFYVDDFLSSKDTVSEAIAEQQGVTHALTQFGFNLCKWKSNSKEFHDHFPDPQKGKVLEFSDNLCKALGILWQPIDDVFTFRLSLDDIKLPLTKRKCVSEIAKLFDPLGWLSPSIILAKLMIQQLWLDAYDWDAKLSIELQEYWLKMRKYLFECDQIKIKRWIGITKTAKSHSLHGFADASTRAYAAVVYIRTEQFDGSIQVNLVAAKSKVAPPNLSNVPRLELCAALLLSKLIAKIVPALEMPEIPIFAYSDNMIVLAWIEGIPIRWQTFVANRVSEIKDNLPTAKWQHVISQLNPADCASRGKFINELRTFDLWWHGPAFLQLSKEQWPISNANQLKFEDIPEQRKQKSVIKVFFGREENDNDLLNRYSNLNRLLHITAYALRWKRYKKACMTSTEENSMLSVEEIDDALKCWVRYVQKQYFTSEWNKLTKGQFVKSSSSILSFTPMFDKKDQILRSATRLRNANLSHDTILPIILPDKGYFTWLLINDAHERVNHAGCQTTLQFIRQRFWILHGGVAVSSQIRKCVLCHRYKAKPQVQLMGDLPKCRVQVSHTFQFTGIDFAGYFEVKTSRRKNAPFVKCYIALFICMTTKAVHLELVRDLSTEAFLDAFRCFTARRGMPSEIFTDRGTNFIGASTEMPNLLFELKNQQTQWVVNELLRDNIKWHFIPAHSPHMGGVWESNIKQMKTHLKRVMHQTRLTEHKFHTVIIQIEAILNSRPLCKLNEDPESLEVLTAGHFLIGRALNTLPEPSYLPLLENRLKAYQYNQRLIQEFWKRWHLEYLHTLQARSKWNRVNNNLAAGQIVLLVEDNMPPAKWPLGRVQKITHGSDGLVRAVEVKCKNSILTRTIHKLCLLPTEDNFELFKPLLKPGQHVGIDKME